MPNTVLRGPESVGPTGSNTVRFVITRIQVRNFRSLRSVDQALDEFHAIVGPNGSGKSSFLDAFAFLSDVLRSGLEGAVFGDGALGVMTRSTDPKMLTWMGTQESFEIAVELAIPSALRNGGRHERRSEGVV